MKVIPEGICECSRKIVCIKIGHNISINNSDIHLNFCSNISLERQNQQIIMAHCLIIHTTGLSTCNFSFSLKMLPDVSCLLWVQLPCTVSHQTSELRTGTYYLAIHIHPVKDGARFCTEVLVTHGRWDQGRLILKTEYNKKTFPTT